MISSKEGKSKRAKYAVRMKSNLESVLADLKEWASVFDVSWYLIIRFTGKEFDRELQPIATEEMGPLSTLKTLRAAISSNVSSDEEMWKTTVFLPEKLFTANHEEIENSGAELWLARDAGENIRYIVDQPSSMSTLSDMCKLAKIFRKIDPHSFGILRCEGLVNAPPVENESTSNRFAFTIPHNLKEPHSLRTFLLSKTQSHPLDDRFNLSKQLAKAVMFIHSAGFVHKNIRPEIILLFHSKEFDKHSLFAFLIGFESFRLAEGNTRHRGDAFWERNIYRHPTRQGIQPEEDYVMQHDIYSLGVCLLEIGMGDSLVLYRVGEKETEPMPNQILFSGTNISATKDRRKKAFETKRALVQLAQDLLPYRMGCRYTEIVITCLTCLDKGENSFGDGEDFLDENGVLVGVRFIEKIVNKLLDIKV
ncbi:hypothetical protein OCU04_012804 [Sclerotinia nivalis]|uniref:Protein kinase domain-containing protein n=1 Tax=Sclerotinia nivalis TaxID=352851 RepID=A0A9X0AAK0_9HELO|nr:hypothetical protein OCU04_012804 [Sclerotinia nivalis]